MSGLTSKNSVTWPCPMPEKAATMNRRLTEILTEMEASYPYYNPHCLRLPKRVKAPTALTSRRTGDTVEFTYRQNGASVVRADLIYTTNGGHRDEEWHRVRATITVDGKVSARLPAGTTHYLINLIDSNNFLVSYPEMQAVEGNKEISSYSALALQFDE